MKVRNPDDGVILINVLVILALTSAIVFAMIRLSDAAVQRSIRFRDAGQGLALISAAETSVIAVLRRDDATVDHLREAWALVGQDPVSIDGGEFALHIEDAQSRFNLNSLSLSGAFGLQVLERIASALDLRDDLPARIAVILAQTGPLTTLDQLLEEAGLSSQELAILRGEVTVLPVVTDLNINTVSDTMLRVLTDNPVQARVLGGIRRRNGFLTSQDMVTAGVILPPGVGYRSGLFTVMTTVRIGTVVQIRESLLQRRQNEIVVVARGVPAQ